MRNEIIAECRSCCGTGLYQGFAEKPGESVVCLGCNGTGAEKISYTPFTGRKEKSGVRRVKLSAGRFIATGVGGQSGSEMTYSEFKSRFTPPVVKSA